MYTLAQDKHKVYNSTYRVCSPQHKILLSKLVLVCCSLDYIQLRGFTYIVRGGFIFGEPQVPVFIKDLYYHFFLFWLGLVGGRGFT